ncbi:hypothetical protein DAETH_32600 (plasmid) [Deinococcus aetherius]|uniref:Short-chain dehydrogenase n=1 Tax=Deinococcus aetherius TaxID=200252 RepID=A0ABN6RIT0_9DEIO|nr:hypothetical protein [Deinococcus aetherius]BDP43291.1 hypothetical protein DAETH_32600 [Deinococcus aetherius]
MTPPLAVIVGAGPNLGLALARRFGEDDHAVALVARDGDHLAGLIGELRAAAITTHA